VPAGTRPSLRPPGQEGEATKQSSGEMRREDAKPWHDGILSAISRTIFSVTSADVAKDALLLAGACAFVFCFRLPMAWI
jgi:hypothetical protein